MRLNIRQLAQSNITFRLKTEEDRAEFWELFIKNRGCTFNKHRSELLNYGKRISPNLDRNKGEIYE